MNALDRLKRLLDQGSQQALARPWGASDSLDKHVADLQRRLRSGAPLPQHDQQEEAVRRFWSNQRIDTLREARLVSYGVALPVGPQRFRIIEDERRFPALIEGVDRYLSKPRQYRRCYQGLLSGYFGYDAEAEKTPKTGRDNWHTLRAYLGERSGRILDRPRNPQWAESLQRHPTLFGEDPCAPYGPALLAGNRTEVDELREVLRISDSSWFMRKLFLAQIQAAIRKPDRPFQDLLAGILELLRENQIIRDQGLALVLDRYANINPAPLHKALRDMAVDGWGNPWLDRNKPRWGLVGPTARTMVTDWLKLEFIETFFTLLAEEHIGDRRRLDFWKRYVGAIDDIHCALGADARANRSSDFVALRKKMEGRRVELRDTAKTNNAFIMKIGPITVVEFSGYSNACYGYQAPLPFHLNTPVCMPVDARNSLKNSANSFRLKHQDNIQGYATWEDRFQAKLAKEYGIHPKEQGGRTQRSENWPVPQTPEPGSSGTAMPQSRYHAILQYASKYELKIEDFRSQNGNLWIRVDDSDSRINKVLSGWGFQYKNSHKGWWWRE